MLLCNVGVLKTVQCATVWQQWLVAGWLGPSVTVRVKVRARAREWCFPFFIFFKSDVLVYMSDHHGGLCLRGHQGRILGFQGILRTVCTLVGNTDIPLSAIVPWQWHTVELSFRIKLCQRRMNMVDL